MPHRRARYSPGTRIENKWLPGACYEQCSMLSRGIMHWPGTAISRMNVVSPRGSRGPVCPAGEARASTSTRPHHRTPAPHPPHQGVVQTPPLPCFSNRKGPHYLRTLRPAVSPCFPIPQKPTVKIRKALPRAGLSSSTSGSGRFQALSQPWTPHSRTRSCRRQAGPQTGSRPSTDQSRPPTPPRGLQLIIHGHDGSAFAPITSSFAAAG